MGEKSRTQQASGTTGDETARKSVGLLLVEANIIQKAHVQAAVAVQKEKGGKLLDILMSLGHLDPHVFAKFLSEQRGIPSLDLSNYQVPGPIVDLVPGEFARAHLVYPIDKMGKLLTLGMECPLDTDAIVELESLTGLKIKPILCSPEDIRNAVEQSYPEEEDAPEPESSTDESPDGAEASASDAPNTPEPSEAQIESGIRLKNVVNHIREIDSLPTLPRTVQRVKEATEDSAASLADIAEIIESDPPIAAKLLRLANSAAYGFPNRVDDITHATSLLGPKETYSVVLSSAILNMTENADGFDHHGYWDDSMFCASAARFVATATFPALNSSAYMAGLLHDIGRYALSQTAPGLYAKIDNNLAGAALISAERRLYLIAHPEAGYFLAAHWGLPEDISDAIRFHHTPDLSRLENKLAHVVAVASELTDFRNGNPEADTPVPEACLAIGAKIGLDLEQILKLFFHTKKAMES